MLDFLISGAEVFDGLKAGSLPLDVGVKDRRIVYMGERLTAAAERRIEARGLVLCPGFIDTHASTGLGYMLPNAADNKLYQGVTTEIIGNCGTSSGPVGPRLVSTMERLAEEIGFDFTWNGLGEWFDQVEAYGLPFNSGSFVGHSTLRAGLVTDYQQVDRTEIDAMCRLLEQGCAEGGLGLSTGLVYAPGSFAATEEIIELARVAARSGGIYVSHIRDERQDLEASIEETVRIGQEAQLPILVSHLKAAERPNWGKIPRVIERLRQARLQGLDVHFEVYPYAAVSTKLRTFIPKEVLADGVSGMIERLRGDTWRQRSIDWLVRRGTDFDAMRLITESLPATRGRSVQQIATERGSEPAATVVDLLLANPDTWIVYHCLSPEDVDLAVLEPSSIICSDSWSHPVNAPNQIGDPHPRTFGAFTRFLEHYALAGRIPFGEAIRKITSLPADVLGLAGRGRIEVGAWADLVLLDPKRIQEKATYDDPRQYSEGTAMVWVNGSVVLESGEIQRQLPGRILRRQNGGA